MPGGRLKEAILVTAIGVALTVILTWPVAYRFSHGGRLDTGDGLFSIWNIAWVARTLVVAPLSVYDANIFHPDRNTLAYSEANLLTGALAIPVYWLTDGNPYAAHNSVLLFAFVSSFVCMYYLAKAVCGSGVFALAPAVAFAFCPYLFARIPHIQLQMTAGLPLALLMFHRLLDERSVVRTVLLGLVLAAQALCCAYYGIFAGLMVGLASLFFAFTRGLWRSKTYWVAVAGAAAISVLLVLPFFLPYVEVRASGFERSLKDAREYAANWKAYLASAAWAHRWMLKFIVRWPEVLFPGFATTLLGLAGLWLGTRPRPVQEATSSQRCSSQRDVAVFYGGLAVLAFWASLGPAAGLYTVLYYAVPVFSFLRAPGRFGVLVTFGLAILMAIALDRLLSRRSKGVRLGAGYAVAAFAALELFSGPIRWHDAHPYLPRAYEMLANMPRGAVLELPYYVQRIDYPRNTIYMMNSTFHWQPLVNGYSDHIPEDYRSNALALSSFPAREAFEIMEKKSVRYVVFHLDRYDARSREKVIDRIQKMYQSFLHPLVRENNVWLYEIAGYPR